MKPLCFALVILLSLLVCSGQTKPSRYGRVSEGYFNGADGVRLFYRKFGIGNDAPKRARMAAPCVLVFEDLDAMIDDQNRAFFLNELDGFESNTGLVALATTNHPDRLDPAILNRPSRFDRKYYFNLPAASERSAYIAAWNKQLQRELRLSESTMLAVVQQTEDFSFAYLKELFVSATMHWMSTKSEPVAGSPRAAVVTTVSATPDSMDRIILEEVARLRAQMAAVASVATGGRVSRSIASARRMFQKA